MNINSPGDIVLSLKNYASNIFEFLTSNKWLFAILWLSLGGEHSKKMKKELNLSVTHCLNII